MKNLKKLINPHTLNLTPYQPGKPIETLAAEYAIPVESIAKLASNESPLGPAPKAIEAMKNAAKEMHLYPDGAAMELRAKLAAHYNLTPDHFAVGQGSNELLELLGHAFLNPEHGLVMSQYAFVVYKLVAKLFDAPCTEVKATARFGHDPKRLIKAANAKGVRLLMICNPNNPTGTFLTRSQLVGILDNVPSSVLVVLDEAYAEIATTRRFPDTVRLLENYPNLMILRTFSKAYGLAGLRIGYAIAHPKLTEVLNRVRQPFNTSRMAQIAAGAALEDVEFLRRSVRHYRAATELFTDFFDGLGLTYIPTCTNFILVNVGDGAAVVQALEKKGLITRPMGAYGLPEWIRISFGTTQENHRLIGELQTILAR